jgi:hypothetical protein
MAKFSSSFGKAVNTQETRTYEGGEGFTRDAKSDLFLLAVTNMVGEDTFYESAKDRDARFEKLIHEVVSDEPEWVQRFIPWLRNTAQMRSASVVLAAEYVRAGGINGRKVIDSAITRADEPMEFLGYWLNKYGRSLPMAVKRGLADAAKRTFTERNVIKYDGSTRAVRMADVLELSHPKPKDDVQAALFKAIINRRHGKPLDLSRLDTLRKAAEIDSLPADDRRDWLNQHGPDGLAEGGYTWERLGGWLPSGWDAAAWEAMIPSMGYMALLRNLRNFDKYGISVQARDVVRARLSDKDEVAKSRQFPYRFLSALKAVDTHNWTSTLETALGYSCQNIPAFDGSTLVLVDVSGSMWTPLTARSQVQRWEVGALFGAALAIRTGGHATLVAFGTDSKEVAFTPNASVLRVIGHIGHANVGHGTNIHGTIDKHWNGHDRIVIFTDMQTHDFAGKGTRQAKFVHGFNLAGYATTAFDSALKGRFEYGGFTDATFRLMPILEQFGHGDWPF